MDTSPIPRIDSVISLIPSISVAIFNNKYLTDESILQVVSVFYYKIHTHTQCQLLITLNNHLSRITIHQPIESVEYSKAQ